MRRLQTNSEPCKTPLELSHVFSVNGYTQNLSLYMHTERELSEIEVFRMSVSNVMSVRKNIQKYYHGDRQLRGQLHTTIYIPCIQDALEHRNPRTSKQPLERAETRFRYKPKTTGTT